MKLLVCVFLVLVILEEYYCESCRDWPCEGNRKDNDSENKLRVGLGITAKTMTSGQSELKRDNGHKTSYLHHKHPPYGPNKLGIRPRYQSDFSHYGYSSNRQNRLGHRSSYRPYHPPSRYPLYRTPHSTNSGRTFQSTYNTARQVGASNGTPKKTPYHRGSYVPQYGRPQYGIRYPTPFGMAHQMPIGAPNGAKNGLPAQKPVKTGDGTPQRKQYFVTPTGIQETPAQPVYIAS